MGDMKVSARDALLYMEAQRQLMLLNGETENKRGGEESRRVKQAREEGKDILAALGQDINEARMLLDGILEVRKQNEAHQEEIEAERQRLIAEEL